MEKYNKFGKLVVVNRGIWGLVPSVLLHWVNNRFQWDEGVESWVATRSLRLRAT